MNNIKNICLPLCCLFVAACNLEARQGVGLSFGVGVDTGRVKVVPNKKEKKDDNNVLSKEEKWRICNMDKVLQNVMRVNGECGQRTDEGTRDAIKQTWEENMNKQSELHATAEAVMQVVNTMVKGIVNSSKTMTNEEKTKKINEECENIKKYILGGIEMKERVDNAMTEKKTITNGFVNLGVNYYYQTDKFLMLVGPKVSVYFGGKAFKKDDEVGKLKAHYTFGFALASCFMWKVSEQVFVGGSVDLGVKMLRFNKIWDEKESKKDDDTKTKYNKKTRSAFVVTPAFNVGVSLSENIMLIGKIGTEITMGGKAKLFDDKQEKEKIGELKLNGVGLYAEVGVSWLF